MGAEQKKLTAVIIGSAPGSDLHCLERYLTGEELIICADGGLRLALDTGLKPDWYVGDSDSGGFVPEGIPCWTLPSEKDLTDLEMAVEIAEQQGVTRVILCGCTGGREDHHLGNLFLLERLSERGMTALIVDRMNEISWLNPGTYTLRNEPRYHYFSLQPADRVLGGLTISGAKYELPGNDVPRGSTLTVSNEFLGDRPVRLSFRAGGAFLIRSIPE